MKIYISFKLTHFGIGFNYSNWDKDKHYLHISLLWLSINVNW